MKKVPQLILLASILILNSCTADDNEQPYIEFMLIENPTNTILVDIIYIVSSDHPNENQYHLNEPEYLKNLNSRYFHRYDIGLILGETRSILNDELYDLKDNLGEEATTFFKETKESFRKDRLNIYVIKRANTIAIAGIGKSRRALITDEFLNKCTSPHEIGHALGLFHNSIYGNIMCQDRSAQRREFNQQQLEIMKRSINNVY